VTLVLWSLVLVGSGLAASRWAATALGRRAGGAAPRAAWLAGLPAFLPAWLVSFVSLLGGASSAPGASRISFLGASAAAILGVLASDGLFAREERRPAGARRLVCWLLGAAALLPAWVVALLLAARLPR
jgi:hypothetical protein